MMEKYLLFICFATHHVVGRGPPGIRPPDTFHAEEWYPKDLLTVAPPWMKPGVDIKLFQTTQPLMTSTPETPESTSTSSDSFSTTSSSQTTATTTGTPFLALVDDDFRIDDNTTDVTDNRMLENLVQNSRSSQELQDLRQQRVDSDTDRMIGNALPVFNATDNVFSNFTETSIEANSSSSSSELDVTEDLKQVLETTSLQPITESVPLFNTSDETLTSVVTLQISNLTEQEIHTTVDMSTEDFDITTPIPTSSTIAMTISSLSSRIESEGPSSHSLASDQLTTPDSMLMTMSMTTTSLPVTSEQAQLDVEDSSAINTPRKECSDLIFVIDSSGNVQEQYEKQKQLVRDIIHGLGEKKRRMALMTYSGRRHQRWNIPLRLNLPTDMYLKKLSRARFLSGITETGAALENIAQELENQKHGPVTVIVLTDGFSFDRIDSGAEKLRNIPGVTVFATGNYFPIVRQVLESLSGPHNVRFGLKAIHRLISELQC